MSKRGLVIVDAWEQCYPDDLKDHPEMEMEIKTFGKYLNEVCKIERNKGTIIIHAVNDFTNRKGIMKEIEIKPEDILMKNESRMRYMDDLRWGGIVENFTELYWSGFHFGRCVHDQAIAICGNKANIVMNLSLIFPTDSWNEIIQEEPTFNYFMWSIMGFEKIELPDYTD